MGVRTTGDIVRLRDACSRVYTRSSTSVSLEDTHRTSSNRPGREERALLFSLSVSSAGTDERRTGSRRKTFSNDDHGVGNTHASLSSKTKIKNTSNSHSLDNTLHQTMTLPTEEAHINLGNKKKT